jgi:hypothetical protein
MMTLSVWRWHDAKGGMRCAFPPYGARAKLRSNGNFSVGADLSHFIHELFKKDDNAMIFLIKLRSPKKQSVFAQAGKPVPPGSLPPGEFSG